ncbi:Uncharacterised protein [uncultured Bacteroides sp.]|nr:Uncharacterised protein [uncultured Bacteroides sp.]
MTAVMPFGCIFSKEDNASASSSRRGRQTTGQDTGTSQRFLVEHRMQQFVELVRLATHQGRLFVNHALVQHFHGDAYHSGTRALSVTGLEEPKLAFLYGELHVLHVVVMVLQLGLKLVEFFVDGGHGFFHGRILGHTFLFRDALQFSPTLRADFRNLLRCADTSYHVLTLSIDQVFPVEQVFSGSGVA